jgi:hypothetical protein
VCAWAAASPSNLLRKTHRLVVSCGLHQIESCTVKGLRKWNRISNESLKPYIRAKNTYVLPPPKDDLEICERINAL